MSEWIDVKDVDSFPMEAGTIVEVAWVTGEIKRYFSWALGLDRERMTHFRVVE